jgi:hypothetical protein
MTAGRKSVSINKEWNTPPKYAGIINKFFNNDIKLDPCSNKQSIINATFKFCLQDKDGLKEKWDYDTIFVNPPYGRNNKTSIKDWIFKCADTKEKYNNEIIALIPVATNTIYWKKYIWNNATAICFLYDTRLKFMINGNVDNKGAPMACCMVYWGNEYKKFYDVFKEFGAVIKI